MIWAIIGVLLVLWIFGFMGEVAGGLIHLLLIVALALLIYNLATGRKHAQE